MTDILVSMYAEPFRNQAVDYDGRNGLNDPFAVFGTVIDFEDGTDLGPYDGQAFRPDPDHYIPHFFHTLVGKRCIDGDDPISLTPFGRQPIVGIVNPNGVENFISYNSFLELVVDIEGDVRWDARNPFTNLPLSDCFIMPWLNVPSQELTRCS
jgi:hypothetical protein